mgnify:FL=1
MNVLMKNTWRGTPYAIAGAIYFGITAMYLPWPTVDNGSAQAPDMGIPTEEQPNDQKPQQRKSCKSHSDCPSPQACVDGVCCLPAVKQRDGRDNYQVRPYPGPTNQPLPSRLYSAPHGLAMLGWYDSLRISK